MEWDRKKNKWMDVLQREGMSENMKIGKRMDIGEEDVRMIDG